ncbi:hypothetical protein [Streptomyces sp. NBC_01508]|uniref:hypothetical protein n=1 Tax=Streptomyces sp. NBC_01508 TaxID=2903888 RepID=UPI003866324B
MPRRASAQLGHVRRLVLTTPSEGPNVIHTHASHTQGREFAPRLGRSLRLVADDDPDA